ncbi:hypothetical protein EAY30_26575, partial [Vibrio anguillarum]|nr:hypothetical protein [Vibrio anguillarum]
MLLAAEFITGLTAAFCIAKVSQAVKTARAAITRDVGVVYRDADAAYKAALDKEINVIVRNSTSRTVRLVARVGVAANILMVTLLVTSIVLEVLSKTTIWQLTILNKSDKDVFWTNK